jgi:hypothetical protein
MKTPKDRARDKRRSPDVENERDRRRAHLAAGGTIANYDTSHYAEHHDIPEGVDWSWTGESMDEQADAAERERTKVPYMSRNAEDIENSKRSRGENL